MSVPTIQVRQPQPHDLIAGSFVIAGFASGFEGVVQWRVLDSAGSSLGDGQLAGVGSNGTEHDFGDQVALTHNTERGDTVTIQVFGEQPTGPDLNQIPVTLFNDMTGFRLYEVKPGDTLTSIATQQGEGGTSANDIFAANRDRLTDPDLIFPGQVLRVPLFS